MGLERSELGILKFELNQLLKNQKIDHLDADLSDPPSEEILKLANELRIPNDIVKISLKDNGQIIDWREKMDEDFGGRLRLTRLDYLFERDEDINYECDLNPEMEQDLREFRIVDIPTTNSQVGFYYFPDEPENEYKELHFRYVNDRFASRLDLDFTGYLKMARASIILYNWQLVLVEINEERETEVSENFRKAVSKINPDFNWSDFVKLYESVRLSNS